MYPKNDWFDQIYTLYAEKLYKFAIRFTGDSSRAEDFVHDTFLTMLIKAGELQSHENIFGWLLVTLRHKIGNDMKRNSAYQEALIQIGEQQLNYDENQFPLEHYLPNGLRQKDKDILIMFYEQELSYEEISKRLNCTIDSCGVRLYRAREACKKLLLVVKICKNSETTGNKSNGEV